MKENRIINAKEVRNYDSNKLKAVQLDLKSRGLYKGKIDGLYGPLTEAAISFQCCEVS